MSGLRPDFPLRIDGRGRSAATGQDDHVHDLVEQVLFTSPGERVNRPTFGCGLLQLVFEPNSEPLALAVKATVQASLQQWLGELIAVDRVDVRAEDSVLRVTVGYTVRATQESRLDEFRSSL
ncbi:GPW/gp25 family protein [Nocardioides taihuensis]|uniref:GPW/gp25 family protein n=1 Tax=Nocardioides taihuensis TaxID=1835606 RepID=A0ABW0BDI9_9ACTN